MPERTTTTKTTSTKKTVEKTEKTPAEKAWDTRRKNEIDNLNEQLDDSIPAAAHKQWMTKKNNEIAEKDAEIAKLKAQLANKK